MARRLLSGLFDGADRKVDQAYEEVGAVAALFLSAGLRQELANTRGKRGRDLKVFLRLPFRNHIRQEIPGVECGDLEA